MNGGVANLFRLVASASLAQIRMTRRSIEDLFPVLTIPFTALVSLAIVVHSGRPDLAGYALVAVLLMTVGQMGLMVGSEIIANERDGQTLELLIATPAPYFVLLLTRILVLSVTGLVGVLESWLIARLIFGLHPEVHHPLVLAATLALTLLAATATSLIAATLFCFGRTTRTYQNAISGPLYLLGGVLVPVTYLPAWLRPFSRMIFLYWSADLLRDSLQPESIERVLPRLGAIAVLGIIGGAIGAVLLHRLLDHLRREGTLGLS